MKWLAHVERILWDKLAESHSGNAPASKWYDPLAMLLYCPGSGGSNGPVLLELQGTMIYKNKVP
jgi:hypothetical protein